ncbi:hypothetical protein [Brevibacillus invocatus]|uniref:hypothetical protein n=1 Tax=Brevibacillus invocatus TaxID=173959 RepID=UPI00203E411B|nr:hypothetical protein [Brevibacillus invocatus]MCM3080291.1 hypothetical protein [Brevibacillus invocatus]MCM3430456.1 hypothetical protein [Brevibacillus invocatus]
MSETKNFVQPLQLGIFAVLSILMLGLHISSALTAADRLAFEWMEVIRADWITTFLNALTFLGGASALAPLGIIVVIVCFLKGYRSEALTIFLTLLVQGKKLVVAHSACCVRAGLLIGCEPCVSGGSLPE